MPVEAFHQCAPGPRSQEGVGAARGRRKMEDIADTSPEVEMAADLGALELTFCGHAAFSIKTPGGKHIIVDPFLTGNPMCPEHLKRPKHVDAILLTHAHGDHMGDTIR